MRATRLVPATAAVLLLAACAADGVGVEQANEVTRSPVVPVTTTATLADPGGSVLGTATFADEDTGVRVDINVHGMTPGAHPARLLGSGRCDGPASDPAGPTHTADGIQLGELPAIQVTDSGVGSMSTLVGSVDLTDLLDEDGTVLVLDAVPSDLVTAASTSPGGAGADATGATGSRTACVAIGV